MLKRKVSDSAAPWHQKLFVESAAIPPPAYTPSAREERGNKAITGIKQHHPADFQPAERQHRPTDLQLGRRQHCPTDLQPVSNKRFRVIINSCQEWCRNWSIESI